MTGCRCDQLPDACLSDADGPDGLCRECRDPGSVCGRWRATGVLERGLVVSGLAPQPFGGLVATVDDLRADVDREGS